MKSAPLVLIFLLLFCFSSAQAKEREIDLFPSSGIIIGKGTESSLILSADMGALLINQIENGRADGRNSFCLHGKIQYLESTNPGVNGFFIGGGAGYWRLYHGLGWKVGFDLLQHRENRNIAGQIRIGTAASFASIELCQTLFGITPELGIFLRIDVGSLLAMELLERR